MKDNQSHIEGPIKHLTPELMEQYVKGTLPPDLKKKIEAFLDQNPFEAEALQGLISSKVDLPEDLSELEGRLSARVRKEPKHNYLLPIAASIALLIISGLVFFYLSPEMTEDSNIATIIEQTEETPVVTPEQETENTLNEQTLSDQDNKEGEALTENVIIEVPDEEEILEQVDGIVIEKTPGAAKIKSVPADVEDQELALESIASAEGIASSPAEIKVVVGKVKSSVSGEPLAGASVAIKDTEIETTSDENGFFHLEAPIEAESLVSINSGYETREVAITESPQIDILMEAQPERSANTNTIRSESKKVDNPKPAASTARRAKANTELPLAQAPDGIYEYLKLNTRYPKTAQENAVQGKVQISFIVNEQGRLQDFEILQKLGYGCDEEAVRVLRQGPRWKPAEINGVPIKSRGNLEIVFPPGR